MNYLFSIMQFDRYKAQDKYPCGKAKLFTVQAEKKTLEKSSPVWKSFQQIGFIMCMVMFCAICFQNVMNNV